MLQNSSKISKTLGKQTLGESRVRKRCKRLMNGNWNVEHQQKGDQMRRTRTHRRSRGGFACMSLRAL